MAHIIFRPQGSTPVKASSVDPHGDSVSLTLTTPGFPQPSIRGDSYSVPAPALEVQSQPLVRESKEIHVSSWLDQEDRIRALQDQLRLSRFTFYFVSSATVIAAVLTHC